MFKKEYVFAGYLAVGMLLGTLEAAKVEKGPKAVSGYHHRLDKENHSAKPYAQGEAIIVMKEDLSRSAAASLLSEQKIKVLKAYKTLSFKSKSTYMLVSGNTSTEELVAQLKKNPDVKSVSPNYRRMISATTPNDLGFGDLWGLHNTGQSVNGTIGISDADIDAPEAWDASTGSSDVVVAVFDTGVDYTHEDLSANMWVNSTEADGTLGVDDDGNGYVDDVYGYDFAGWTDGSNDPDPMDIMGHGTHVSGTIGAKGDNSVGITGVNWDVKIMALKVFRPDLGAYDSDILEAVDYVLKMKSNGVNVVAINASYGGNCGTGFQNDPMNDAIKSLGDAGIVFAAAAGNEGNDNDTTPSCPASYDASNIIAVAAIDQNDDLASFSNYGATSVDIAAPGTNILSTLPSFTMPNNSIFSDDVESGEGNWITSGTWAITNEKANSPTRAWSDSPNANYTNNADTSLTYNSDIDLSGYTGQNIGLGACLIYDIEGGWDYLYIEASDDSGSNWTTLGGITGDTQNAWECSGVVIPENMKTAHFRMRLRLVTDSSEVRDGVYVDDIAIGMISPSDDYAYWAGTSMATPHVTGAVALMAAAFPAESVAERIDRILNSKDPLTSLNGKVVTGGRLNLANSMALTTVNHDPVAQNDSVSVVEGSSVNIAVLSNDSDVDGDTLSISAVSSPVHGTTAISGTQITYTPDADYNGPDSFEYTVSDGHGGTDTATVNVTVTPVNHPPVAQNDTATVAEDGSVNIAVLSNDSDVDGDTLSISAVGSPVHGTTAISGTQITYTPYADYNGPDSFEYTVSDGHGGTDTATVNVTVTAAGGNGGGGGGGCSYNPHTKSIDLMILLMMMLSFFYSLKRKYLS